MNNEQAIKAAIDAGVPVPFEALLKQPTNTEKVRGRLWKRYRKTCESWGSDAAVTELIEGLVALKVGG